MVPVELLGTGRDCAARSSQDALPAQEAAAPGDEGGSGWASRFMEAPGAVLRDGWEMFHLGGAYSARLMEGCFLLVRRKDKEMRCIWNIDEVHSIEMQISGTFLRKPTKQQLEEKRLANKEIIVLLLNSDLLAQSPHYNSLQLMIPARNINILLPKEKVFAWLEQKSNQIGEVTLDNKEVQQLEDFLYECDPFYDHINRLRNAGAEEKV